MISVTDLENNAASWVKAEADNVERKIDKELGDKWFPGKKLQDVYFYTIVKPAVLHELKRRYEASKEWLFTWVTGSDYRESWTWTTITLTSVKNAAINISNP